MNPNMGHVLTDTYRVLLLQHVDNDSYIYFRQSDRRWLMFGENKIFLVGLGSGCRFRIPTHDIDDEVVYIILILVG